MKCRFAACLVNFFLSGIFWVPALAEADSTETLKVAVASNFMVPMKAISEKFEQASGHRVSLSFGSSGKLYAQILNGAPFHLFLSADQIKPEALELADLIVPESRYTYAVGQLVLIESAHSGHSDASLDAKSRLENGDFGKLAIANPRVAPYGQAAMETLESLGLTGKLSAKIVRGENISQAYQFVATGNADLGLVAASQLAFLVGVESKNLADPASFWLVPEQLHTPIRQDMVLLKTAKKTHAALEFYDWIRNPETLALIQSYGYAVVPQMPEEPELGTGDR